MSQPQPMDTSKLNNAPAPLPIPTAEQEEHSPPLRSPDDMSSSSAYLEGSAGETPAHPTVAETGALSVSPGHGPGPSTGQLQRRESIPSNRIIRLASFGGEGLVAKPPPAEGSPTEAAAGIDTSAIEL